MHRKKIISFLSMRNFRYDSAVKVQLMLFTEGSARIQIEVIIQAGEDHMDVRLSDNSKSSQGVRLCHETLLVLS